MCSTSKQQISAGNRKNDSPLRLSSTRSLSRREPFSQLRRCVFLELLLRDYTLELHAYVNILQAALLTF